MPTIARAFLDTNVLVYAFVKDDSRTAVARKLIAAGGVVSVQNLNEFVNVMRRKLARDWPDIASALAVLRRALGEPLPVTSAAHDRAVVLSGRYGFRIYDSLVLSSASIAGCRIIYTEDLQDGQVVDGVLIRNPFATPSS